MLKEQIDAEALTVVLKVTLIEQDTVCDFDDPGAIARASEGFCPFPRHYGRRHYGAHPDDEVSVDPVPVCVMPNGLVECQWGRDHGRDATTMRYEWFSTNGGSHEAQSVSC